jgi:Activator of Hsp90 ATPase homolog 1-like protein
MNANTSKNASLKKSPSRTTSFTTSILVDQSPREVFDAVNDVRGWWSGEIEGPTDHLGAVFEYRYKDMHRTTQKITECVPGKRVVWHVTESHIGFVDDKEEWKGTDIVFEIARTGGKTELRFTHVGLVPAIACYGKCEGAWTFLIQESLRDRITKGRGTSQGRF